jgi:hypothetical protein
LTKFKIIYFLFMNYKFHKSIKIDKVAMAEQTKSNIMILTELINSVDNALCTVKSIYVMKDAYNKLTSLLEENNYNNLTVVVDVKLLVVEKNQKKLLK